MYLFITLTRAGKVKFTHRWSSTGPTPPTIQPGFLSHQAEPAFSWDPIFLCKTWVDQKTRQDRGPSRTGLMICSPIPLPDGATLIVTGNKPPLRFTESSWSLKKCRIDAWLTSFQGPSAAFVRWQIGNKKVLLQDLRWEDLQCFDVFYTVWFRHWEFNILYLIKTDDEMHFPLTATWQVGLVCHVFFPPSWFLPSFLFLSSFSISFSVFFTVLCDNRSPLVVDKGWPANRGQKDRSGIEVEVYRANLLFSGQIHSFPPARTSRKHCWGFAADKNQACRNCCIAGSHVTTSALHCWLPVTFLSHYFVKQSQAVE